MVPEKLNKKKRSKGITIFGIIHLVFYGLVSLTISIQWIFSAFQLPPDETRLIWVGALTKAEYRILLAILLLLWSIIHIISGLGLLKVKEWGRKITIAIGVFRMIWSLMLPFFAIILLSRLKTSIQQEIIGTTIRIIYSCILIYFFTRPKVKEQFKQGEK